MGTTRVAWLLGGLMVTVSMTSCARFDRWGWFGGGEEGQPAASEPAPSAPVASDAEREDLLRQAIGEYMAATSGDEARLVRRRPYWYREYSVYSGGPEAARISVSETDSRLRPYVATVEIDKQRFSTRIHRDRAEAEADRNFLRDTGTETLNYEWRGGHWDRAGSLFVAQATEEQIGGEWVPVQETEHRTVAVEEEQSEGFLGRLWSVVSGD